MDTLKFKTNIKCGGCEATVTPFLDKVVGANNWKVDTQDPDKILTVATEKASAEDVINALKQAGYTAQVKA